METSLKIYSAAISVCSHVVILLCFANTKGSWFMSNDQPSFLPCINSSFSWFLLGKRNIFYFYSVCGYCLDQLAAFRLLQIIVNSPDRSRKVAQQALFWKRHYEHIQSSVCSWVQVLRFQGLSLGRKWWLILMPVHINQNGHFLDCLFKQHLWHRFQSAAPRLTADVCLMASHLHCYLESPFGNNSSISNHKNPRQHYQNHLPWAIQMKALRGKNM